MRQNCVDMTSDPIIVADIGGTNARFGIATLHGDTVHIDRQCQLHCSDFDDFEGVLSGYLKTLNGTTIGQVCIAVAAPVLAGDVSFTNLEWRFSKSEICRTFGFDRIEVINDFAAVAAAVPHLTDSDLSVISTGKKVADAPIAVVGPGTGLGVAALLPGVDGWTVLPSEGGHATIACTGPLEFELIHRISEGSGNVPAETLLSGAGILKIYNTLCLMSDLHPVAGSPEEVTTAALSNTDAQAVEALSVFCRLLGGGGG